MNSFILLLLIYVLAVIISFSLGCYIGIEIMKDRIRKGIRRWKYERN